MSEPGAGTSTSEPEAGIHKSEVGADTGVSQVEVGRHILAEAADSRVQALGALDVAGRYSIAVARGLYTQPALLGHSRMTSLVV
jgi:hypothetical protein